MRLVFLTLLTLMGASCAQAQRNSSRYYEDLSGYTILLYSGSSRESAMETKKKVTTELPDFVTTLQYNQPKFRLTAGAYFTRLEAEKDLYRLRRFLPTAILVPEKIPMR